MKLTEETRKEMLSSDTKEVAKILETLDENSIVLARTYMTALSDRQRLKRRSWQRQQYENLGQLQEGGEKGTW